MVRHEKDKFDFYRFCDKVCDQGTMRSRSPHSDEIPLRGNNPVGIEHDGFFGVRRPCERISLFEIAFMILGVLATMATVGLSIYRIVKAPSDDPDVAYSILIIISSVFLLIFLATGIFQQRITDIVTFFITDLLLTIYVVVHFILRSRDNDDTADDTEKTLRLVRLICTATFNLLFLPLSIMVIRKYRRDEFSQRLFGAFPAARWPLRIYNVFDCVARINTMLSISVCFLNLYNKNDFLPYDRVFLGVGVPLALLWLGLGVGMIRLESRLLMVFFYLISLFQPTFIVLCLISAIEYPSTSTTVPSTISTILTTLTSTTVTASTALTSTTVTASTALTSTTVTASTTLTTTITTNLAHLDIINLMTTPATFSFYAILESARKIPVEVVLYVCAGFNAIAHILTIILTIICVRNFGRGLKETVFVSELDRFFQRRCTRS